MLRKQLDKSFLFLIFLCLLFAAIILFIILNIRVDEFTEVIKSRDTVVSAIIVSQENKPLITEIFFYDNRTGRGALYNIPENMGTLIKSMNKMGRLDLLFDRGDPLPYINKIGELIGIDIDFYIHLEMDNLVKAVDIMEGLNLFIPNEIWQVGSFTNHILPSGSVILFGDKVKSYLTYRLVTDTDNDIIIRKHDFTKAFLRKIGLIERDADNKLFDDFLFKLLDTNLDRHAFDSYLSVLATLDTDRLVLQKVLGKTRVVDEENLLFPYYDEKLMREMTRQIVDTLANMDVYSDEDIVVSVEIRNGTDIAGLASRTAQLFLSYGYRVSAYKNADTDDYENTIVIDRRGNPDAAKRVASLIRCERIHQVQEETPDDTVDVIIIIGKDFDGRYVKK